MIPGLPRRILAGLAALLLLVAPSAPAAIASPFADWTAVFVAGDWRANNGAPTEAFDNARRDAAAAFQRAGFSAQNISQFSVRPARYPAARPLASTPSAIDAALRAQASRATGGCLVYFTSHGDPRGLQLGERILTPRQMAVMIDRSCAKRPTVVIVSACFSGVFLPALAAPHRLVLTAARADRSSFGCTESDQYPFFDACLLETLPIASDFADLGRRARGCVDRRERAEGLTPASEPQMQIGAGLQPLLPLQTFTAVPPKVAKP